MKKRKNSFNFFEIALEPDCVGKHDREYVFQPSVVYEMTIVYKKKKWKILELWEAV